MKKTLLNVILFFAWLQYGQAQFLYGTTQAGGISGAGTITRLDAASNTLTVIKSFDVLPTRPRYTSFIQATNGKLYGMTEDGGNLNYGTILSYDPVTDSYATQKYFDGTNGADPRGSLVQASNGKFYGMTFDGGNSNLGVIFLLIRLLRLIPTCIILTATVAAGPMAA